MVPGTDLFNQMPSEVVLLVFKWLPKCTLAKSARGESPQIIKNLYLGIWKLSSEEADKILSIYLNIILFLPVSVQAVAAAESGRVSVAAAGPRPRHRACWRRGSGQYSTVQYSSTVNSYSTVQYSTG